MKKPLLTLMAFGSICSKLSSHFAKKTLKLMFFNDVVVVVNLYSFALQEEEDFFSTSNLESSFQCLLSLPAAASRSND